MLLQVVCDLPSLKPLRIPRNVPGISSTAQTFGLPVQNLRTAALAEKPVEMCFIGSADPPGHRSYMPGLRKILGQLPHRGKHQAEKRGKCWKLHLKISWKCWLSAFPSSKFRFRCGMLRRAMQLQRFQCPRVGSHHTFAMRWQPRSGSPCTRMIRMMTWISWMLISMIFGQVFLSWLLFRKMNQPKMLTTQRLPSARGCHISPHSSTRCHPDTKRTWIAGIAAVSHILVHSGACKYLNVVKPAKSMMAVHDFVDQEVMFVFWMSFPE